MIQYFAKQQPRTSAFALVYWLLLSAFSCGSLAASLPSLSSESNSASTMADMADNSGQTQASLPQSERQGPSANMDCCDEQLQQFDCCERDSIALSSQFSEALNKLGDLSPDFSAVAIAANLRDAALANGRTPNLKRFQHTLWLMDGYPRIHLVHCTLLD